MILFFDTSALVKFFHREEGTDVVTSLITDSGNRCQSWPDLNLYMPSIGDTE